jgi:hypothetical protein
VEENEFLYILVHKELTLRIFYTLNAVTLRRAIITTGSFQNLRKFISGNHFNPIVLAAEFIWNPTLITLSLVQRFRVLLGTVACLRFAAFCCIVPTHSEVSSIKFPEYSPFSRNGNWNMLEVPVLNYAHITTL